MSRRTYGAEGNAVAKREGSVSLGAIGKHHSRPDVDGYDD